MKVKTVILSIAAVSMIVAATLGGTYLWSSKNQVEVPVASHTLNQRSTLQEDDILFKKVDRSSLPQGIALTKEEVIGQLVALQNKIPEGSFFFLETIESPNSAIDRPSLKLLEGQTALVLEAADSGLSLGSLQEDQRVDVFCTIRPRTGLPLTDRILTSARILELKDRQGYALGSEKSTGVASSLVLAIESADVEQLAQLAEVGDFNFYATSQTYMNQEAQLNEDSMIFRWLNEEMQRTE